MKVSNFLTSDFYIFSGTVTMLIMQILQRKLHHWKIWYFHNTVKPHFNTDTRLIRTPRSLLLNNDRGVPEKKKPLWQCWKDKNDTTKVYHGLQPQWRNSNSFNNNKSLAHQDECDTNTQEKENMPTQYKTVTHLCCRQSAGITFSVNST